MFWKLYKKVLKTIAKNILWYKWRIFLLKLCDYRIGRDVYIGEELIVVEELEDHWNVEIGDRASLAPRVTIVTSSHPNFSRIRPSVPTPRGKVVVEADAWVGTGAILLPNVRVGKGAVVGAGAVVTKDVAPYSIVVGIPAKVVGQVKPLPAD